MSTLLWFLGFGLMMLSFSFLFKKGENLDRPRISVDPWWPESDRKRR